MSAIDTSHSDFRNILKFDDQGLHRFGGGLGNIITEGLPEGAQVHHIATLDLSDPHLTIESEDDVLNFVPLLYPLKDDGGYIQYSVLSDQHLKIHSISNEEGMEFEPNSLPEKRFRLHKLTYDEERLLCAIDGSFYPNHLNPEDSKIEELLEGGNPWRVGGHFMPNQGAVWELCENPDCSWRDGFGGDTDTKSAIQPIALIPATTVQLGDIWGDWPEDVEFFFGYCPHCGAIHAVNRCT